MAKEICYQCIIIKEGGKGRCEKSSNPARTYQIHECIWKIICKFAKLKKEHLASSQASTRVQQQQISLC